MRRKKSITISLFTVLVLSLTACGKPQNQDAAGQESSGGEEPWVGASVLQESADYENVETEVSESETAEAETGENDSQNMSAFEEALPGDLKSNAALEETVLVDENDVRITITGMDYTDDSIELKLMLENNSGKTLSFLSGTGNYNCNAVNGYMVDQGYLNAKISAGKKANETIRFDKEELFLYGITEIADIQLGFALMDESYEDIYIEPRRVCTDIADSFDYGADTYRQTVDSGIWEKNYNCTVDYWAEEELYNQGGVRVISEALMTNKDGGKNILLEVRNDSEEQIGVISSDIAVNGLMICDSAWSGDYINSGTCRVIALPLFSMLEEPYWEAFNLSDIGNVEFSLSLCSLDGEVIAAPQEINISMAEDIMAPDDTGDELYSENGIRIVSKGLYEDTFSYSDDIHMLFLVENLSSETIYIDDSYESLSVNGFMTDCYTLRCEVPSGKYAFIDVEMWASSLEDNGITCIEDIAEVEIDFEIEDGDYDRIADPTVSITY